MHGVTKHAHAMMLSVYMMVPAALIRCAGPALRDMNRGHHPTG